MHIQTGPSGLPRSTHWRRISADGTIKSRPSQGMDLTPECLRSPEVSWLHQVLPVLYPGILTDSQATARPYETSNNMALGQKRTTGIQDPKGQDDQQTCPIAAGLR